MLGYMSGRQASRLVRRRCLTDDVGVGAARAGSAPRLLLGPGRSALSLRYLLIMFLARDLVQVFSPAGPWGLSSPFLSVLAL